MDNFRVVANNSDYPPVGEVNNADKINYQNILSVFIEFGGYLDGGLFCERI